MRLGEMTGKSCDCSDSVLGFLVVLVLAATASGQGTREDYERAAGLGKVWNEARREFRPAVRWLPNGAGAAWMEDGGWRVAEVGKSGTRSVKSLASWGVGDGPVRLAPLRNWGRSTNGGEATSITFENTFKRTIRLFWVDTGGSPRQYGVIEAGRKRDMSTYAGHVWIADFEANDLAGAFRAGPIPGVARFDDRSRKLTRPEPKKERPVRLEIVEHDLVIVNRGKRTTVTDDGTPEHFYRATRHMSPDGRRALALHVLRGEMRRIPLIESSPRDRLQPELHWLDYNKPGDAVEQIVPVIVDISRKKVTRVKSDVFDDTYRVGSFRWSKDGREVFCVVNKRGHQELLVVAVNAASGNVRTVVRESSQTFVDYSQKTFLHWFADGKRLLWTSERDGRNHLYLYDIKKGRVLRQVTRGEWVVRKVERVDEKGGEVLLTAMGLRAGEDPYHRHLVRVRLDGGEPQRLTEGDGDHDWTFSPDGQLFIDRWSRVDQPRVTELRSLGDASLIAEMGRDDATALEAAGLKPPQRFAAPGRDGKTMIHGIIIRPTNFDPSRSYPVIEDIYAGPHGFHVPKRYGPHLRQRRLAELGFVVVRIDGMGTNWRSKAFHDVCWQNIKDAGFPDRIAWLKAAADEHPEMDLSRVGIFGGSAGGQNTVSALLHHADFYSVGVADCGCHDNRMDKIWWNEAWMGKVGPHYEASSNAAHAEKLEGHLLLTLGEMDRNVDPASTMQLVDALIRADKDFDFIVVPGGGHGVGETPYMSRRRQDYFVRHLHGVEPRR